MPLDEQEKMDEEEEERQSIMARPNSNVTLFVPDMDDFARMANAASTPFTGYFKIGFGFQH
jgi:hypothetical protein